MKERITKFIGIIAAVFMLFGNVVPVYAAVEEGAAPEVSPVVLEEPVVPTCELPNDLNAKVYVNVETPGVAIYYAKIADVLHLEFSAPNSEYTVGSPLEKDVSVSLQNPATGCYDYSVSYIFDDSGSIAEGEVPIEIYDNADTTMPAVTQLDMSTKVIFDKTAPVFTESKPTPQLKKLASVNGLISKEVIALEANQNVNVTTDWQIVPTRAGAIVSYDVTYNATDLARNVAEPKVYPVDLMELPVLELPVYVPTPPTVTLLGDQSASAEKGDVYKDSGVNISWLDGDSIILTLAGNLNLSVVKNEYTLSYVAAIPARSLGLNQAVVEEGVVKTNFATRKVNVIDTTAPKPVTGFYLVSGDDFIDLHWVNPTDEDFNGVIIYRSLVSGVRGDIIATTSKITESFEDTDVVDGTTYYYTVIAMDNASPVNMSLPSPQLSATPLEPVLVAGATYYGGGEDTTEVVTETPTENVKADTDEPKEEKSGTLPWVGVGLLVVLALVGLYLLYLQYPNWFSWLFFWKKKKKKK